MTTTTNVDLPDADAIMGKASFRVLESFDATAPEEVREDVRDRMRLALTHWPELRGETITVAQRKEWDDKLGRADMLNRIVYLPVEHRSSFVTVYHELGHLAVQVRDERNKDVPTTSERYCSLLALSRMPVDRIDEDRVPYFPDPEIPQSEWPAVAAAALEYREDNRDYCQQAIEWFAGAWDGDRDE